MREIIRAASIVALLLIVSGIANSQTDWKGSYEFDEDGGKNAGGVAIFIAHQLAVIDGAEGLAATLQSNGYQTSVDLVCTAKIDGAKLLIYFENYGENNLFEPYQQGDLLFTLERKTEKGKPVILTHWGKFTPSISKYEKSGKVYFQPTKESKL